MLQCTAVGAERLGKNFLQHFLQYLVEFSSMFFTELDSSIPVLLAYVQCHECTDVIKFKVDFSCIGVLILSVEHCAAQLRCCSSDCKRCSGAVVQ
jgi:hypothetical protein